MEFYINTIKRLEFYELKNGCNCLDSYGIEKDFYNKIGCILKSPLNNDKIKSKKWYRD